MVVWDTSVKNPHFLKNYVCHYHATDKETRRALVSELFDKNKPRHS